MRVTAQTPGSAPTLQVARICGQGVVLQRGARVPVWGTSAPGARVSVSLRGQLVGAIADASGAWRVTLDEMTAGGPFQMTVRAGQDSLVVRDVLVGDASIASGPASVADRMGGRWRWRRAGAGHWRPRIVHLERGDRVGRIGGPCWRGTGFVPSHDDPVIAAVDQGNRGDLIMMDRPNDLA